MSLFISIMPPLDNLGILCPPFSILYFNNEIFSIYILKILGICAPLFQWLFSEIISEKASNLFRMSAFALSKSVSANLPLMCIKRLWSSFFSSINFYISLLFSSCISYSEIPISLKYWSTELCFSLNILRNPYIDFSFAKTISLSISGCSFKYASSLCLLNSLLIA